MCCNIATAIKIIEITRFLNIININAVTKTSSNRMFSKPTIIDKLILISSYLYSGADGIPFQDGNLT